MSRAFVSENDGWYYCRSHLQSCKYADEYGQCMKRRCVFEPPEDEPGPAPIPDPAAHAVP
ncbi:MAG: hypothetical protein FWC46_07580 [Actinomycetia bacterium]|nr:hypothetical protein [Actinomycetes bacterium]